MWQARVEAASPSSTDARPAAEPISALAPEKPGEEVFSTPSPGKVVDYFFVPICSTLIEWDSIVGPKWRGATGSGRDDRTSSDLFKFSRY